MIIDHIGIAVHRIEEALPLYRGIVGLQVIHEEIIEDQKVRAVFLQVGESTIELLEPTAEDSPIAIFLVKKGSGIHHIAYQVDDVAAKLAEAKAAGIRLIDEAPRPGGHGKMIAFLHPKDTQGVLIEYCQRV